MSQFPPFRPSHPPSRVAAPIRQQVQDEARKAAVKIREAVEQFTAATGLELHVNVNYTTTRTMCDPVDMLHVTGVELDAGGVRVHG